MNVNQLINKFQALFFIPLLWLTVTACAQNKTSPMTVFDYDKAWKEVNEFQLKALPESALQTVNNIYNHAKKEENASQLIKAIIHQLKFTEYKEENAYVKNLERLKAEAYAATFPAKPILHSLLAEMYWQYYQNYRYIFHNRSVIRDYKQEDVATWSLEKIVGETFAQHKLALQDADKSKTIPISHYDEIIIKGNLAGRRIRPTLYDFVTHRALEFTQSAETELSRPAYTFEVNQASYLAPAKDFIQLNFVSRDTLSLKHFAMQLFQDLIRFHIGDADPEALADVDIERIAFVNEHLVHPDKDSLFLKALNDLEKALVRHPVSTRVSWLKASFYQQSALLYKPLVSDEHKWDLKTSIAIADSALQRFKDSEGAIMCENLQLQIRTKDMSAVIEENNLPGMPFRSLIRYRNFTDLNYRVVKITREEVRSERKKWDTNYKVDREKKFIEHFTSKTPAQTGKFTLPDDGDMQQHSAEVKIDALPPGEYMIIFSNRTDFNTSDNGLAYAFTTVSNLSFVHRQAKDGSTEFYVMHGGTGEPMVGVTATVYAGKYNYRSGYYEPVKLNTYSTDTKGFFRIPYLRTDDQRTFFVDFNYKNETNSTESIERERYNAGSMGQYKEEKAPRRTQTCPASPPQEDPRPCHLPSRADDLL